MNNCVEMPCNCMHLGREMFTEGSEEQIIALILFFLVPTVYFLTIALDRTT